ncbi:MAG: hypothetical protein H6765_00285 [Candidatus Peribacteria bacterium]|nr:MAG: hypothetical protein H6765_00285 [Candidatus Peribacteria bacterium]
MGNVVDPLDWVQRYDRDAIVMYLFGDLAIGSDGSISEERLADVYKSMLVGGW